MRRALLAAAGLLLLLAPSGSAQMALYLGNGGLQSCGDNPLLLEAPGEGYACRFGPATAVAGQPDTSITYTFTTRDGTPELDSGEAASVILLVGGQAGDFPQTLRLAVNLTARGAGASAVLGAASADCPIASGPVRCEFPFRFPHVPLGNETEVALAVTFEQAAGGFTPAINVGGPDPSRVDFPAAHVQLGPTPPGSPAKGSPLPPAALLLAALAAAAGLARRRRGNNEATSPFA